jgi:hypothetical protein
VLSRLTPETLVGKVRAGLAGPPVLQEAAA